MKNLKVSDASEQLLLVIKKVAHSQQFREDYLEYGNLMTELFSIKVRKATLNAIDEVSKSLDRKKSTIRDKLVRQQGVEDSNEFYTNLSLFFQGSSLQLKDSILPKETKEEFATISMELDKIYEEFQSTVRQEGKGE